MKTPAINCTFTFKLVCLLIGLFVMSQSGTVLAAENQELNLKTRFNQPRGAPPMLSFERLAPRIGEQLPDLSIYDDSGKPVNIRELAKGKYTVLILGCLT